MSSEFERFLTDVRVRAADRLTADVCGACGDPADVHEDVREALWGFFEEIRERVEGPKCSGRVAIGTNAFAACDLLNDHHGECEPCVGSRLSAASSVPNETP